jgi:hypothetical protein
MRGGPVKSDRFQVVQGELALVTRAGPGAGSLARFAAANLDVVVKELDSGKVVNAGQDGGTIAAG